jgi:hypothetical protein
MVARYTTQPEYEGPWVYVRGRDHGLVGPGAKVKIRRDVPGAEVGDIRTVEEVVNDGLGTCAKHALLSLEGITVSVHRKSVKVDRDCAEMMSQSP